MAKNRNDSITVWLKDSDKKERKPFRCNKCGKIIFEYYDDLNIIIPGESESKGRGISIQCKGSIRHTDSETGREYTTRCGELYNLE